MKIPGQGTPSQTSASTNSSAEASSSSARVLYSKVAIRSNRAATGDSPNDDAKPLLALTPFPSLPQPGEPLKSENTPSPTITTDVMRVENLATEIAYEIRCTGCDDIHGVDIQFASQILEGLRVSISGTDRELSITFAAQSNEVTALLSQHASELIDRLKADGLAIGNIRIVTEAGKNTDRGGLRWKGSTQRSNT